MVEENKVEEAEQEYYSILFRMNSNDKKDIDDKSNLVELAEYQGYRDMQKPVPNNKDE